MVRNQLTCKLCDDEVICCLANDAQGECILHARYQVYSIITTCICIQKIISFLHIVGVHYSDHVPSQRPRSWVNADRNLMCLHQSNSQACWRGRFCIIIIIIITTIIILITITIIIITCSIQHISKEQYIFIRALTPRQMTETVIGYSHEKNTPYELRKKTKRKEHKRSPYTCRGILKAQVLIYKEICVQSQWEVLNFMNNRQEEKVSPQGCRKQNVRMCEVWVIFV